ncbi:thioredoxin domain-containing protein [Oceaniferula spumae]
MTASNQSPADPANAESNRAPSKPNHLAGEKSPYLIQHVRNPVDWYPWGEEAFAKARKENKPILLSIGYSTCHWCHVMERESFENKEIAELLSKNFVAIKVDREERPDVDKVYMTAYEAMYDEGGGWPLNMFLTPDLKPFAGGTYFPPEDKHGRPGFKRVLNGLVKTWNEKGPEVVKSANDIHASMSRTLLEAEVEKGAMGIKDLDLAAATLIKEADMKNGGWGQGPKFPQVSHLRFLLRQWQRTGNEDALKVVVLTCEKMMEGGIHDQLSGGFHRYAVDGVWLVPHFEKMLYDQAQLLDLYLDVWLVTGDRRFRKVAKDLSDYVLREMQDAQGGFYCAQDAQSEGKEGKFACWTMAQMKGVLEADELKLAVRWFGVTEKGNFLDHSDPAPLPNQNVLYVADPKWKLTASESKTLESAINKMKSARLERKPAATDDKILADWNGMMIQSLARAGRVLAEPRYLEAASKAHAFVKSKLWDGKTLYHRWRDGERDSTQQASSYLQMIAGSLSLYQTTLKPEYLEFAVVLAEGARKLFYDEKDGGFYIGTKRDDLVLRLKDDFDAAVPTASSVGAMQFLALAEITGRKDFREVVTKTLASNAQNMQQSPHTLAWMLCVADSDLGKHARLVIAGDENKEDFLTSRYRIYSPRLIVMGNTGAVDDFSRGLKEIEGKSAAYYCEGQTCQPPVGDPAALTKLLAPRR